MKRQVRYAALLALAVMVQGYGGSSQADNRTESVRDHHRQPVAGGPLRLHCETLDASLSAPNTVFTSSTSVAAGTLTLAGQDIGAHCLLVGKMFERVSPVDGKTYAIGFQMRLPLDWNGRFFYQANGGIDGNVVTATGNTSGGGPLTSALLQGFAVISSDAGHSAMQNPTFGIDPQARLDYGYQAVGKLTPMAKRVIRAAYGKRPERSYIGGCSNGGRHTMVAAARYTDEYDGYLVGSPGFNLPKAAVANIYGGQQYKPFAVPGAIIPAGPFAGLPDLSGAFTPAERQLVANRVLGRCDALDGLVDGLVQNVRACQRTFDLATDVPTCGGPRDGTCLSAGQKTAIGNIFAGPKDSDGQPIYATFPYDAGLGSTGIPFWEFIAPVALDSGAVGFVFKTPPENPVGFNGGTFALTANIDLLAEQIFATNATYTESGMSFMTPPRPDRIDDRLRRHGGRMIVYHGVSDPIFSVDDTTAWYRTLKRSGEGHGGHGGWHHDRDDDDDRVNDVVRLFHVPGMGHCSGGPATDQFDMLSALVDWVENRDAPAQMIATARGAGNVGGVNLEVPGNWAANRTRPLCPYPRIARYRGGDPERAESFVCR
jgi:feruloyl esterase